MFKNNKQLNINKNEERLSSPGFVVDLRQKINTEFIRETKVIEKKATVAKTKIIKFEKRIKFNLLKKEEKMIRSSRNMPDWHFYAPKSLNPARLFNFLGSINISRFFIRKPSPWLKFFKKEANLFRQASHLNYKLVKHKIDQKKEARDYVARAEVAETKVAWYRSILSFVLVLILIIVPLKLLAYFEFLDLGLLEQKILGRSQLALNNLMAATEAVTKMDFKVADLQFQNAGDNFVAAQEELSKINDSVLSLAALSNDPKLKLAAESKKFLQAGSIISSFGRNLVLATDSLFSSQEKSFSDSLDKFTYYGELAVIDAHDLKNELAKVNPENLPVQYQEKFTSITEQTARLAENLDAFVSAGTKFKNVLGATKDKRYLLVFQNNSELRASGGFLGSYALVDIRDGKIRNLEVPGGGSYDTEGGMSVSVVAPKPLWLVNPLWHFWDANWWPDWPTTAKNLMWFYEKSNGPTVDGVISVTPTVVEGLLEITGPVDLKAEYGLVIDANNFWDLVQKIVEQKNLAKTNPESIIGIPATSSVIISDLPLKQDLNVNTENKPKKIIGDLMTKILETLPSKLNKESLGKILALFENTLAQKQVLFYFTDPTLQEEVAKRNWAGEVKDTSRDYLMVVNTNIAGQKSDRKMTESIEQVSEVAEDGSIVNTVKIKRTHTGLKNEVMTGVRNVDWLRVYVPKGSELLTVDGFRIPDAKYFDEQPDPKWQESQFLAKENLALTHELSGTKVYEENNKTVFANWLMVDPGETVIVTIKYRLPFNFLDEVSEDNWLTKINLFLNPKQNNLIPYSFLAQKQPGAKSSEFNSHLILPDTWSVFWRYPDSLEGSHGWDISDKLDADKYWSILIDKQ